MASLSDQIGMEMGKSRQVDPLKAQIDEKQKLIARYNGDRKDLLPKDAGEMAERLQEVLAAAKNSQRYSVLCQSKGFPRWSWKRDSGSEKEPGT
ncbi:MAG: hypothetical protein VCE75_21920 [Alphaproteobacteria bacterium]